MSGTLKLLKEARAVKVIVVKAMANLNNQTQ